MVGSTGVGDGRSKEAAGMMMMALHQALRNVCLDSDWAYSVFWTVRPRPRRRGGSGCKVGDDNGSLMLMWEDGFCRMRMAEGLEDQMDGEDPIRKAFGKMSIQLYNYGEGLMGKVASDKCHKWVFKDPPLSSSSSSDQCEHNIYNRWESSFDALPPEWADQFASGIQIPEDLQFVLRMRHVFESLGYQSSFFRSQLFSSCGTSSPSSSSYSDTPIQTQDKPPPTTFNWTRQIPEPILIHHPTMPDHEPELKWPNGLSLFTALTGGTDNAKLLIGDNQGLGSENKAENNNSAEEYLGLDARNSNNEREMENGGNFKRSFTMPERMVNSSPSLSSLDQDQDQVQNRVQHQLRGMEYKRSGGGIYSEFTETFLE